MWVKRRPVTLLVMNNIAAIVALVCGVGCAAAPDTVNQTQEATPWSAPDQWGPLDVGAATMRWVDARGKPMVAEVWFPAVAEATDTPEPYPPMAISGEAFRGVEWDDRYGPYPLVAFSHGYGGVRFQSLYLTEFLASHGFVVVSPDHTHNTFLDLNDDHLIDIVVQRPGDVIESVDELLSRSRDPEDRFGGLVDGNQYAVLGHSFGGLTSMMVGGGRLNIEGLLARCDSGRGRLCSTLTQLTEQHLEGHQMRDPRAVVTVPMSPGLWYAFGSDGETAPGLEGVQNPLVLGGDADPVLSFDEEIVPSFSNMAAPKTLVNFHQTGHYAFSNMCDLAPFFTDECTSDEQTWTNVERVQQQSRTVLLAHIRSLLNGEAKDAPYRAEEWFAGVTDVTVDTER